MSPVITLTTDFGYKDPFVGEMKGIILSINPRVLPVDITHAITPQDIREGALLIGESCRYFPKGSIHVVVVDPGVGSGRRAIIVEAGGHLFVGPDNGVFSTVLSSPESVRVIHILEEKYVLSLQSPTFQGRDVFAPAAAWLSRGVALEEFGPRIDDPVRIVFPLPRQEGEGITGEVIYIDRFGNAITNIRRSDLETLGVWHAELKGIPIPPVGHYAQAEENSLSCLINSSGHLELFVNRGDASGRYGIRKGDPVMLRRCNQK
ncbi:MAG: SAM-dependent chlorinase/fluorinase [Alphaproteobacteria bacterium]|uniref:SAM-dependent chlorinase/fluorinase n=1 Tax=Candidatus Nitrobium versatile TaxID=2884831 RepID=A0A953M182_9BACT|nr:SAM-dependent chlorinase/fluorinase [Candidatus Nitrobium versatile]